MRLWPIELYRTDRWQSYVQFRETGKYFSISPRSGDFLRGLVRREAGKNRKVAGNSRVTDEDQDVLPVPLPAQRSGS